MSGTKFIERAIITRLVEELALAGFVPVKFWDGGDYQDIQFRASTVKSAMERTMKSVFDAVESVDEGTLHFAPKADLKAWGRLGVLLVLGNGVDVISDHHVADFAPTFARAIDRVMEWINKEMGP